MAKRSISFMRCNAKLSQPGSRAQLPFRNAVKPISFVALSICLMAVIALAPSADAAEASSPESSPPPTASQRVVVHAGHVIAEPGKPVLQEQSLVIENGHFTAIEAGYIEAPDAIDLKDAWVLPGLIDLHTHVTVLIDFSSGLPPQVPVMLANMTRGSKSMLQALVYAQSMLAVGFTTLRNVGHPSGVLYDLRDAINQGLVPGPRIFGVQSQIVVSGGDYDRVAFGSYSEATLGLLDFNGVCDGVDGCRRAVRQEIRRGADVIKIRISGAGTDIGPNALYESHEEMQSIINTAHSLNRTVAVHSHTPTGSALVLELGADTVEHGLPPADQFGLFHRKNGRDSYFVPTLTAFDSIRDMLLKMTGEDWYAKAATELKAAYDAGVPIAFGTDAGAFPHAQANREFGLMAAAGMSNEDVLKAATVNAAEALQKSD
ncbi:MAG: hypothetical protein EXR85_02430 [Xanthomonadales bacterium]|nr:hypothetical protein [Xanthomonadales bacterium]